MMRRTLAATLLLLAAAPGAAAEPAPDVAPADAWPMARGSRVGTGRSAGLVALPLAEVWHLEFEKTAFGAVPVV